MDVVVRQCAAVLKLLASVDQVLQAYGNVLLVADLGLDELNRVRGLHLKGEGLADGGPDKDLHANVISGILVK